MDIIRLKLSDIEPYKNNAKVHTDEQIQQIKSSIEKFGNNDPIAVWGDNNIIVEGHGRYTALKELGYDEAECIRLDHLSEAERKAYALAHNKINMNTGFDDALLTAELEALRDIDFDIELTGFDFDELENSLLYDDADDMGETLDESRPTLSEKFIIPPFSVLDTRQGNWQQRKRIWKGIIKSSVGRDDGLLGSGLRELAEKQGSNLTGTSIFDPVLCEVLINWFCPKGGKILDPFAGGSVRGLISVLLGNDYTGIDLSSKQIAANIENYNSIADKNDLHGNLLKKPEWICDDSMNIDSVVSGEYDFVMTCPPYADLEVYSDDPRDISNMPYDDFRNTYSAILKKAADKLKDNAFMAIVVGEVRDKKGYYHNFVGDTINACKDAGLKYYNECILIEMAGTAPLRVGKQFSAKRKVVKTHQNVLVFVKGDEKEISNRLESYNYNIEEMGADE